MHQFHKDGLRHHFWVGSRKQQRQPVKPKLFVKVGSIKYWLLFDKNFIDDVIFSRFGV